MDEKNKKAETRSVSETIDMISKYKGECSAWEFLCDTAKSELPKEKLLYGMLVSF